MSENKAARPQWIHFSFFFCSRLTVLIWRSFMNVTTNKSIGILTLIQKFIHMYISSYKYVRTYEDLYNLHFTICIRNLAFNGAILKGRGSVVLRTCSVHTHLNYCRLSTTGFQPDCLRLHFPTLSRTSGQCDMSHVGRDLFYWQYLNINCDNSCRQRQRRLLGIHAYGKKS